MGFFKENDWTEETTSVIDSVAVAKLIRENDLVKNEIKKVFEGDNGSLNKILSRISKIEKTLEEMSNTNPSAGVVTENESLSSKIEAKIVQYKCSIENMDIQICTIYGKAHRNGEEVDMQEVDLLEKEIERYKEKIKLLEPLLEVLTEI